MTEPRSPRSPREYEHHSEHRYSESGSCFDTNVDLDSLDHEHLLAYCKEVVHHLDNSRRENSSLTCKLRVMIDEAEMKRINTENTDLKNLLAEVKKENEVYKEKIVGLETSMSVLSQKYDALAQPLSARQMAFNADVKAMKLAFPAAKSKPYCIRSFSNLKLFIEKPESDQYSGPDAYDAWKALSLVDRDAIKKRVIKIDATYKYLRHSIATLKEANSKLAHSVTSYEDTVKFFADDEDIVECIKCVHHFVETEMPHELVRQVSESDNDYSYVDGVDLSSYAW